MTSRHTLIVACALLGSAPTVQAAQLSSINGSAQVKMGTGYQKGALGQTLPAGTQVMVPPGSQAQISYSNSCKVTVNPGTIYTVAAQPPCVPGAIISTTPDLTTLSNVLGAVTVIAPAIYGIYDANRPSSP